MESLKIIFRTHDVVTIFVTTKASSLWVNSQTQSVMLLERYIGTHPGMVFIFDQDVKDETIWFCNIRDYLVCFEVVEI